MALFFFSPIKQKNLKGKQSKFSHTLSVIIFMSKGLLIGLVKQSLLNCQVYKFWMKIYANQNKQHLNYNLGIKQEFPITN